MTLNEIAAAILAMPIDSTTQLLCVDVTRPDYGVYVVGGMYYSTAIDAAAAVQDLA